MFFWVSYDEQVNQHHYSCDLHFGNRINILLSILAIICVIVVKDISICTSDSPLLYFCCYYILNPWVTSLITHLFDNKYHHNSLDHCIQSYTIIPKAMICQGRRHRSRGLAVLTTSQSVLLDQRSCSWSPCLTITGEM